MSTLLFDIEADGLNATKVYCIVTIDTETEEVKTYGPDALDDGVASLLSADRLVGHNIIGYDIPTLDRLYNTSLLNKPVHDTWVMSQTLRYTRTHKHGLAGWGEYLGNKKIEYSDWSAFSEEMLQYCIQDCKVNLDVYKVLLKEYATIYKKNPMIRDGLQVEQAIAKVNVMMRTDGWNYDEDLAKQTEAMFVERMHQIERILEPKLGTYEVFIDKEPKTPKFKKNGEYAAATVRILSEYFGKEIKPTDTHLMPAGKQFQRSKVEQIDLGQIALVKEWLLSQGWEPDDYTRKKMPDGSWKNMGPKLTDTSLEKFGADGKMISEYYTLRNRLSVLEGWKEKVKDGRLHGNMWTIGTPSFRCRHEVIVNLPSVDATYGKPMRTVLKSDEGDVIVGCDSSGNQLRGLCHYLKNPEFTNEIINGDQHQRNADALSRAIGKEVSRQTAKGFLYCYMFGGGDAKLGEVLSGYRNPKVGKVAKDAFSKAIKGLGELKQKIEREWEEKKLTQGIGWIEGLDGRPVFVPSQHQCLNYLLQSAEGITCKASVAYAMEKIQEENLRAKPRIFYHDEMAFTVHPDDAKRVGEILKEAFQEAPKTFGIECMEGGNYVIGESYADVH